MTQMKLFHIDFTDKRRVQHSMNAETKEEVINYITKKYKSGFIVTEVQK